jgi:hypothetical protein
MRDKYKHEPRYSNCNELTYEGGCYICCISREIMGMGSRRTDTSNIAVAREGC